MKTHVHFPLEKEQAKSLKIIDKWLVDNMFSNGLGGEDLVMKLRETITKIEEKGYYNQVEKELLNELRYQFVNETNIE